MKRSNTPEKILDAAERLLSQKGVNEVSLREITKAAGVNVASVNYHFGSKLRLVEAVLKRRLEPINHERLARLQALETSSRESGIPPKVREIMQALFEPVLSHLESPYFVRLVARSMTDPDETVKKIFLREIAPVFMLAFSLLRQACPDVPEDVLFWRVQFAMGSMGHSLWAFGRVNLVPKGVDPNLSKERLLKLWLDFVVAGIAGGGPDV